MPFKEKEKTIDAENRFKAGEVTVNKQEVTIGTGNVVMATKVPGGVILKVHKPKLKDIKSDLNTDVKKSDLNTELKNVVMATRVPGGVILKVHKAKLKVLKSDFQPVSQSDPVEAVSQPGPVEAVSQPRPVEAVSQPRTVEAVAQPDPKPDPESDVKKPDLKSDLQSDPRSNLKTELKTDLKTDLRSSKPVEVAAELVRWAKLGEPVLVNKPRADHEQEAAEDNAGRSDNEMEEDKVEKKAKAEEETVTRGSGTVSVYPIKNMSNGQGKPVGEITKQGEPAEEPVETTVVGMVGASARVVTNTEEESVKFIVRGMVEDRSRVVTNTAEEPFNNTIVVLGGEPDLCAYKLGDQILGPTSGGTRSKRVKGTECARKFATTVAKDAKDAKDATEDTTDPSLATAGATEFATAGATEFATAGVATEGGVMVP